MKRLTLLAIIGLFFAAPALLQNANDCDTASLQAAIQTQLDEIEDDPVAALKEIIQLALDGLFRCADDPQAFSGEPGAQPVLGPLALHEGFYIVTLKTAGSARVDATSLESCGKDASSTMFNFSSGQAIFGAENLIEIEEDCTVYLELSKISASWSLEIEQVR